MSALQPHPNVIFFPFLTIKGHKAKTSARKASVTGTKKNLYTESKTQDTYSILYSQTAA